MMPEGKNVNSFKLGEGGLTGFLERKPKHGTLIKLYSKNIIYKYKTNRRTDFLKNVN